MLGGSRVRNDLSSGIVGPSPVPVCCRALGVVLNLRSGRVWRPESAFQFPDKWITFHDAGFKRARSRPASMAPCCSGAGFTRSGASLVFVA